MLDVVRAGLARADDVQIAVSFTRCSGLGLLIDPLRELAARGGRARLLTSTYQAITQPEALEALLRLSPGVEAKLQDGPMGFHAKFWWFHEQQGGECWAGSSNLSKGGLATSLEWNLRRTDPATLELTRAQLDALWRRDDVQPLSASAIDAYRRRYLEARRAPSLAPVAAEGPPEPVRPNAAQVEALRQLAEVRAAGGRRTAVIAATGIGKTWLAALDVHRSGARTALYVSHRLEHLLGARDTFSRVFPSRRLGVVGGGLDEAGADIVFATIASLAGRPSLVARPFEYLVVDEFHHVQAPSYEVLRPLRERAFVLGLTATPERQDGHDVLAWCDWNVAYEVRLPEAIDRGWLLPFHYFGIADETLDFTKVRWRRLEEVEDALSVEARVDQVLHHALERGFDGVKRAAIGFCAGLRHAWFMAEAFLRRGQDACWVSGEQPVEERRALYARLADPEDPLAWLFVSDVLNEGVDIPAVNTILFLRPTESATLFLQQLGRGLRLFPGTEVLTVLDFVGHHRSAWVTLHALHAPGGGGIRTEITDGVVLMPPRACEIVLQRRTREILAKVERFTTRREACDEAWERLTAELGRCPMPVDLWSRVDVPDLATFRGAYGSWLEGQRAHGCEPAWARGLADDDPVVRLLRLAEADWQAQRVSPYALLWGLCAEPSDPSRGYERFFERWPHWRAERSPLEGSKTWATVRRKLGEVLDGDRLKLAVQERLGDALLGEVEGRLLYTVNSDHQERHGGILRTPAELNLFARYLRPEILRHFGVHYDPARHNTGMLWLGDEGVIITKLDTSSAKSQHQYTNRLVDAERFVWTSQNQMSELNERGRRLIEHEARGLRLHLFVQPHSHAPAFYLGTGRVETATGAGPMQVVMRLHRPIPEDVLRELVGAA